MTNKSSNLDTPDLPVNPGSGAPWHDLAWYMKGRYGTDASTAHSMLVEYGLGTREVQVAVADSRVDFAHTHLADNKGVYIDFAEYDYPLSQRGGPAHGTAVAGVVQYMAPDVTLHSYDVFRGADPINGAGDKQAFLDSIRHAADNGVDVVNVSYRPIQDYGTLGHSGQFYDDLQEALNYAHSKDTLVVFAAGNNGLEHTRALDNMVAVGASNSWGWKASFSSYGADFVDVFAPGDQMATTHVNQSYRVAGGTSLAAPIVAGIAALLKSVDPNLTADQVYEKIVGSTTYVRGLANVSIGNGVVNALNAFSVGTDGDEHILGYDGDDTLFAGAGNDIIIGGRGADTIDGGDGVDTVSYAYARDAVNVHLSQGTATDVDGAIDTLQNVENVIGGAGNDRVVGNARNNKINGGDGDDLLVLRRGNDIGMGGDGNDIIGGDAGNDRLFGENGNDELKGGSGNDRLDGGAGNDILVLGGGHDTGIGGNGKDTISGGHGNDRILGQNGNDRLYGENGNDRLHGQKGNDRLDGGAGNDILSGGLGRDTLIDGAGNDTLHGGAHGDVLVLWHGNDKANGNSGNDRITSRSDAGEVEIAQDTSMARYFANQSNEAANDILTGGSGADTFVFRADLNATEAIVRKHTKDNGKIDWKGVTGENDNPHDHWVNGIGHDTITDYNKTAGDVIRLVGHTVAVGDVTQIDDNGDGIADYSIITMISDQGGNGGAHDQDVLGTITVRGDLVNIDDIQVNAAPTLGVAGRLDDWLDMFT